jgi:hypothetical protein
MIIKFVCIDSDTLYQQVIDEFKQMEIEMQKKITHYLTLLLKNVNFITGLYKIPKKKDMIYSLEIIVCQLKKLLTYVCSEAIILYINHLSGTTERMKELNFRYIENHSIVIKDLIGLLEPLNVIMQTLPQNEQQKIKQILLKNKQIQLKQIQKQRQKYQQSYK